MIPYAPDTTPAIVAITLADKVALIERYAPTEGLGWDVRVDPDLGDGWVLRWDRVTLTIGEDSDLQLARFVALERTRARQALRATVVATVAELGLEHPGRYSWPADLAQVRERLTRCPVCLTRGLASTHRPGSDDCLDAREERRVAHAE